MPARCVVFGCTSKSGEGSNVSFYKLPKHEALRNIWISIIRLKQQAGWEPGKSCCICSQHFGRDDFHQSFDYNVKCRRLLPLAIPTLIDRSQDKTSYYNALLTSPLKEFRRVDRSSQTRRWKTWHAVSVQNCGIQTISTKELSTDAGTQTDQDNLFVPLLQSSPRKFLRTKTNVKPMDVEYASDGNESQFAETDREATQPKNHLTEEGNDNQEIGFEASGDEDATNMSGDSWDPWQLVVPKLEIPDSDTEGCEREIGALEGKGSKESDDTSNTHTCLWMLEETVGMCAKVFHNPKGLGEHVEVEHIGGLGHEASYVCRWHNCDNNLRPFRLKNTLLAHLSTHTGHKTYQRKFVCSKDLEAHTPDPRGIHNNVKKSPKRSKEHYQCGFPGCNRVFPNKEALDKHVMGHRTMLMRKKVLECPFAYCQKMFANKALFEAHLASHEPKLPSWENMVVSETTSEETPLNAANKEPNVPNEDQSAASGNCEPPFEGFQDGRRSAESQRVGDFHRMKRLLETEDEARERERKTVEASVISHLVPFIKITKSPLIDNIIKTPKKCNSNTKHVRLVSYTETCAFPGCNEKFDSWDGLQSHRLTHRTMSVTNKKFECSFDGCTRSFSMRSLFDAHIAAHETQQQNVCEKVASQGLSWKELDETYILPDNLPMEDKEAWRLVVPKIEPQQDSSNSDVEMGFLQPKIELEEGDVHSDEI